MTSDLRGSLFMTAAMAGFAIEDAFVKVICRSMALGQMLVLMGMLGVAVFAGLALLAGEAPLPRSALTATMAVRSGFEIAGRLFYALAIALTPLATASAILQATPLVVVLGAVLLFGERVSLGRWGLIVLGLVGVLVILRPGIDGFSPLSLLALLAMIGFAGRDLATRAAPMSLSNAQLGVAGYLMLTLSGLIILASSGGATVPEGRLLGWLLLAAGFGIAAYAALTAAMRTGDVAAVTPFRYARLLFAMILGRVVFGENPDAATLTGAGIIVSSGVILMARRRAG